VTEGTAMAPWNGPNKTTIPQLIANNMSVCFFPKHVYMYGDNKSDICFAVAKGSLVW